ncbi:MAG TPA: hypothetical protein VFZ61_03755 [Polyangiales bacterium]
MIKLEGKYIRALRRRVTWLELRIEEKRAKCWAARDPEAYVALERKELDALYAVLGQVEGGLEAPKQGDAA